MLANRDEGQNRIVNIKKEKFDQLVEVKRYLNNFRVKRGEEYTNTGMNNQCLEYGNFNFNGSFCVPDEEYESFLEHISRFVFDYGIELGLTERHLDTLSPIVIDLDFRFKPEHGAQRQHNLQQIIKFIKEYHAVLTDIVDLHEHQRDKFRYFILERPEARLDEAKGVVKDGVHIVCPDLQLSYPILFMIREFVIRKMGDVFEDKKFHEIQPFSECFDKSVIRDSNWMIHGNTKKDIPSYKLSAVISIGKDNRVGKVKIRNNPRYSDRNLIKILSIRNNIVGGAMRVRDKWQKQVDAYTKKINRKLTTKPANTFTNTQNQEINQPDNTLPQFVNTDNYTFIEKLVDCLCPERAGPYESWIRVGWCLRNIASDLGIPDRYMFSLWIAFSRKSPNYNEGAEHREYWFERFWNNSRDGGLKLTLGSLRYWAKEDNPEAYEKIISVKIDKKIDMAVKNKSSHVSVSDLIYEFSSDKFVSTLSGSNGWYYFMESQHRWIEDKGNHYLYGIITRNAVNYVNRRIRAIEDKFQREAEEADEAVDMKEREAKTKPYRDLLLKMQDMSYIDKLVKACGHKLYDSKFYENLDSNVNLICFSNGVLDLSTCEFRDGKPEDFISQTTGYEFIPECDPFEKEELMRIFRQILPYRSVREYFLTILASCLQGGNKDQSFYILQNSSGANGKTLLMELMLKAFGQNEDGYGNKFNVAILLEKRASGASAHPEMAKLRGKRFTYCEEPDEDKPVNTGLLKELTGGGSLTTRALFKDPITFEIQTKFMMCCNDLPRINADDDGTWRRLKNIHFPSRFLHEDSEDYRVAIERGDQHIYPRDDTLKNRLEELKGTFMAILFDYYKKYIYKKNSIIIPPEVLKASKDYQQEQDILRSWIELNLDVKPESRIGIDKIHKKFQKDNAEFKGRYSKAKLYKKISDIFRREIQNGDIIENKQRKQFEGIGFHDNGEAGFGEDVNV
jgi:P4 family phage/plasmid primase-like protien